MNRHEAIDARAPGAHGRWPVMLLLWLSLKMGVSDLSKAISRLIRDPACWLLCAIFTVLFFGQALIIIDDLGLALGFETDPGSHIAAIEALLKTYNMHSGYHSRYYGWTYFALNFWLLTPLNLFLSAFSITEKSSLYLSIRLILFFLGMASAVGFYELLRLVAKSTASAFVGSLLYILSPICSRYFYIIHPETCGTLFLLLGCIGLVRFAGTADVRLYVLSLICLVLASLSKQIYFFAAIPVLIGFLLLHCNLTGRSLARFVISGAFFRTLFWSGIAAFLMLFAIHPFAILQPQEFLLSQSVLGGFVNGAGAMSLSAALAYWEKIIISNPLFIVGGPILLVSIVLFLFQYIKTKRPEFVLGLTNCLGIIFVGTLIVTLNRLFVNDFYLQPIVPFVIVSVICALSLALRNYKRWPYFLLTVMIGYSLTIAGGLSFAEANARLVERLDYKSSVAYQTYMYIKTNLTKTDKIAYDHLVAMPDSMQGRACHYWQGCGTDMIDTFAPNYVMFNDEFTINKATPLETERLKRYVEENRMVLVKTILSVKVYKKE